MKEKYLIKRIRDKGDKLAANKLIRLYYNQIYIYVFKQINDKEVSMDLTQEIFISMLKSIDGYEEKRASFKTWLYKIASNKVIDYYRSKYYKFTTITVDIEQESLVNLHNIEESFQIKEDAREVMEVISMLDGDIQQVLRMKIFAEMTFKEMGNILGMKESTLKTKYYSSLKKIKNILKEAENEERFRYANSRDKY